MKKILALTVICATCLLAGVEAYADGQSGDALGDMSRLGMITPKGVWDGRR